MCTDKLGKRIVKSQLHQSFGLMRAILVNSSQCETEAHVTSHEYRALFGRQSLGIFFKPMLIFSEILKKICREGEKRQRKLLLILLTLQNVLLNYSCQIKCKPQVGLRGLRHMLHIMPCTYILQPRHSYSGKPQSSRCILPSTKPPRPYQSPILLHPPKKPRRCFGLFNITLSYRTV